MPIYTWPSGLDFPQRYFYGKFKSTMMSRLQQEKTWIEAHPMSMATIETTLIGWFCEAHDPDATNFCFLASKLSSQLILHFSANKTDLVKFARWYPTLSNWKGDILPPVVAKTLKPKWQTNCKKFTANTIGVVVPKAFCALLQKMVQEIDLAKNAGKTTFVDMAMSYTGSPLHMEYGK